MTSRKRISCINKQDSHNPHEKIINIGGVSAGERWKYSQAQAAAYSERGICSFYIKVGKCTVDVVVATHMSNKYLKTQPDVTGKDYLLSLPECSLL